MNPLDIRKGIDDAINQIRALSIDSNSDPVRAKLKSARLHITVELELIDVAVIRALSGDRIPVVRFGEDESGRRVLLEVQS